MICCSEHNCRQENEGTHRQPRKWPEMEKHWKTPENPAFAWLVVGSVGDTVWQCDTVVGSVGDSQGLPGIAERTNGVISGLITGRRISCHPQKYWNTKMKPQNFWQRKMPGHGKRGDIICFPLPSCRFEYVTVSRLQWITICMFSRASFPAMTNLPRK